MIVFRQLDEGYPTPGIHWNVEFFDDASHMFPIGTAYVAAAENSAVALLKFILVADEWRQEKVATKLLDAIKQRWPEIQSSGPMGPAGERLLRATNIYYSTGEED